MESPKDQVRYKLILGKVRVSKVFQKPYSTEFQIDLPGSVTMTLTGPPADVKEGDLLTLYTEILANAHSSQPPVQ